MNMDLNNKNRVHGNRQGKEEVATQNTQLPHHYIENLASFQFRNHKRRNSTALKFEEPKYCDNILHTI